MRNETKRRPKRALDLVRLSDVKPEQVEWLWRGRIPRGKVTLLVGDPGAGKSFASLAIAAAITTGNFLPDDHTEREPRNVLLWNGEDGLEDTIRIRAEAVGVALGRLTVIRGMVDDDGKRSPFSLGNVHELSSAVTRIRNVSLIIIDPIAALLSRVDTHRDAEVRAALQPLVDLARDLNVAILCVLHLRKGEAQRALYRVGGSIGFVGLARSVLLAASDPEDGRRAIAPLKSNLSAHSKPIEYRIGESGEWQWGEAASDLDAERLLRSTLSGNDGRTNEAVEFLRGVLGSGPRSSREVADEALAAGFSKRTLDRARQTLQIVSERVGGIAGAGEWVLRWPKAAKETPGTLSGAERSIALDDGLAEVEI